jgi:integrase
MGGERTGVKQAGKKIQVEFTYRTIRCRETIDLPWTVSNKKATENSLRQIKKEIKDGTFNFAEHFPNSLKVRRGIFPKTGAEARKFADVIDAWLNIKSAETSSNTRKLYKNAGEVWKVIFFDRSMSEMGEEFTRTTIADWPFASSNLFNDYMIIFRGACALYASGNPSWKNPALAILNRPTQEPDPDPLSYEETGKVLDYMKMNFDPRIHAWFMFMFETGERPEEGIAHKWKDVDWSAKKIHVERTRTNSTDGPCKTYAVRNVDLSEKALDALRVMHSHPKTKTSDEDVIFQNPNFDGKFNDNRSQSDLWNKALNACKIRARRSYQTRHTYATTRLSVGGAPMYVSRQMGHKNMTMLLEVYSTWIDGDKSERERIAALLEARALLK